MKPPLNLLIVHGGGSRVLRVCVPRWLAYGGVGLVAAVAGAMATISGEYVLLRREASEMVAVRQRMDEQRALIVSSQTRVAEVRSEIGAWKMLHTKMWETLGPEAAEGRLETTDAPTSAAPVKADLGAELDLLATSVDEEGMRLRELEGAISRAGKVIEALPLRWPVRGQVKSEYGPRRSPWSGMPERHAGIDIGSPPGTPVRAPAAGTVVVASFQGGYGKEITLDHGNGVRSRYGHLEKLDVKAGQTVEKGQAIGLVGSTGRSTGPHLHYEVLVEGKPVDPREFLAEH